MTTHDIIVIGASAGGVEASMKLVHALPADLPASVFIVLHIPPGSPSLLPQILSRAGSLPVTQPEDDTPIEHRHIYVAPPDRHLILEKGRIRIVLGPEENRHRPAVDPLFRSAALVYGPQVIGVILTGALDDGTAGLIAVKQRGGIAVVQDPNDALYPSMPQSALSYVNVDHLLPLSHIGPLLAQLSHEKSIAAPEAPVNDIMQQEVGIATMKPDTFFRDNPVGFLLSRVWWRPVGTT